jgi:hypothetical protein
MNRIPLIGLPQLVTGPETGLRYRPPPLIDEEDATMGFPRLALGVVAFRRHR